MARAIRVNNEQGHPHGWKILCPACHRYHVFSTEEPNENGARWTFNGDRDKPTFKPSMLERDGYGATARVCHSSVREGRIHFHMDCTDEFAVQTLDLPDAKSQDNDKTCADVDL